jgi:hypothetical protein
MTVGWSSTADGRLLPVILPLEPSSRPARSWESMESIGRLLEVLLLMDGTPSGPVRSPAKIFGESVRRNA